jgi:hypothetical protein
MEEIRAGLFKIVAQGHDPMTGSPAWSMLRARSWPSRSTSATGPSRSTRRPGSELLAAEDPA